MREGSVVIRRTSLEVSKYSLTAGSVDQVCRPSNDLAANWTCSRVIVAGLIRLMMTMTMAVVHLSREVGRLCVVERGCICCCADEAWSSKVEPERKVQMQWTGNGGRLRLNGEGQARHASSCSVR